MSLTRRLLLLILSGGCLSFPTKGATVVLQQGVIPTLDGNNLGSTAYGGTLDALVTTGPTNNLTTNNYGSAGAIGVSAPPPSLGGSATLNTKGEFRSLIQFDLAAVKNAFDTQFGAGQWIATQVQLSFTATSPNNGLFNGSGGTPQNRAGSFDMKWLSDDSWLEGTGTPGVPVSNTNSTGIITYSNLLGHYTGALDQSLGTFSFTGTNAALNSALYSYTMGSSPGLLGDILGGSKASFELLAPTDASVSALFNSASFNNGGSSDTSTYLPFRPSLSVTAVAAPEPGRAMLFLLGGIALLVRRRRTSP